MTQGVPIFVRYLDGRLVLTTRTARGRVDRPLNLRERIAWRILGFWAVEWGLIR